MLYFFTFIALFEFKDIFFVPFFFIEAFKKKRQIILFDNILIKS